MLLLLAFALLWSAVAWAGTLTAAQKATLVTDITVTNAAEFATAVSANSDDIIATAYNTLATPDFWVWRSAVSRTELLFGTSVDGTTYNFTGTGYVGRTSQELQLFESLFDKTTGLTDPSNAQVRTAFTTAISGAVAPAPANITHMATIARRKATRLEKLLATGAGTTATPANMGFEGTITGRAVANALRGVPLQ